MVLAKLLDQIKLFYVLLLILIRDLMLALKLLCVLHNFFLSCTLQASLVDLLIFILSGKNGKSLCNIRICFGYSTSTSKIYPISLFSSYFFINSSLNFYM